eukprot:TRINITY_DN5100_c2_g1_i1.p1 TRINITY_DN5100_c2_g1~~TRINITY_DN5100_c2_g1_i1.p1  ORF type:complete len:699 (-),score=260.90 TRINITY_DN5100_c2_g1_i1:312-2408(-)
MKFGKYLKENSKPEWKLYYLDYKLLKNLIKKMVKQLAEGNMTKIEIETPFINTIEQETTKVNDFFLQMEIEILGKLRQFKQLLSSKEVLGFGKHSQANTDALKFEIDYLADMLTDLAQYTNVNFKGIRKILKKHDRHTGMVALPWFLSKLKHQPFYSSSKQFGNMLVKFSECCSKVRKIIGAKEKEIDVVEGGFQAFQRQTTKYWVNEEDIMRVKTIIAKHLPVYIFTSSSARFPRNPTDGANISSCYYDNPDTMELYEGRLKKTEGAIAIRFRNYEANPDEIFVERKTHHESWVVGGGSVKERFDLDRSDVFDFVRGTYTLNDYINRLHEQDKEDKDIKIACKLFTEVQNAIIERNLKPAMTTEYNRTAFQIPGDASVRISIDTNLKMIRQSLNLKNDGRWRKEQGQIEESDVHDFPYAVLEVKLQVHEGVEPPEWVTELIESELVRIAVKYSKYIHGCAMLVPDLVPGYPVWIKEFDNHEKEQKEREKQIKREIDQSQGIFELLEEEEDDDDRVNDPNYLEEDDDIELHFFGKHDKEEYVSVKPEKSIIQKVSDFFNFDRFFTSGEKPIFTRMKIEPKTYFANERTFLQWMSFCIVIQAIGIALISFPNNNFVGITSGIFFVIISVIFMGYSLFLFRWRAARIRNNQPGRYDDVWGPVALFVIMVLAVLANGVFYIYQQSTADPDDVDPLVTMIHN